MVHYKLGEKYDGHYDWSNSGYPETRFITVLIYLTDMRNSSAGGETAFMKANNRHGMKIHPGERNCGCGCDVSIELYCVQFAVYVQCMHCNVMYCDIRRLFRLDWWCSFFTLLTPC